MLKGMIVYNGVTIKLIARATMNDIRLYLYNDKIDDNYEKMVQLFDNWGDDEKPYYTDDFRRLDVQLQKNSFKTNLRNVEMSAKIAGMIKYAVAHCDKVKYAEKEADFTSDTVKMIYNTANELAGKVKFSYGIVQEIVVRNEHVLVSIKYEQDNTNEDVGKIFGELKVKDNYGNILSKTPVINKTYKLSTDLLGNLYTHVPVQHNSSVEGVVGLYATLEDVKRAHPEKNFAWIDDKKYYIVEDENLEEIIADFMQHDGWVAFDTETSGLNITFKSRTGEADQLVGVVLSKEFGTSYYFPLQHKAIKNLCNGDHFFFMEHYMRDLLEKKDIVMHNTNFDWKVAYIYDINIHVVYDTQFAVGVTKRYEVENYTMGLKPLEKIFFGIDAFELSDFVDGEWGENDIRFWDLPYEYVRQYACPDADYTLGLALHFKKIGLVEQYDAQRVFELEIQFAKVVAYSEFWGYHIDIDNIPTMHDEIVKEMAKQKQAMFDMVGYEFNPNSPIQLCKAMYDDLGIELIGGKRSTSKDVLKALSSRATENGEPKYPFVHALKAYRKAEGTYKNFLKKLDKEVCAKEKLEVVATDDGYIFPEVYQLGTNTGRCSIKNPNYQSYNDIVKKYIIPRPGFMMVDSDFAQIEYRVLASMAGQQTLIEAFNDPDLDYHTYQASRMHNVPYASVTKQLRQQSKGINFGLPYGMADPALGAAIFGEKTPENTKKAAALRKKFFEGQERIENLFATVRSQGVAKGYTSTWLGRRRYYQKGKFDEGAIRRQAGNHVIQGSAADIYKTAVVRLFNRIEKEGLLGKILFLGFIHDELLTEVHNSIDPYYFMQLWREEYQLQIDGFCRLFAGIGFGYCWYDAKKKDLPPQYVNQIISEYENGTSPEWDGNHKAFIDRVYTGLVEFEHKRVIDYVQAEESQGQVIAPVISSLLHDIVEDETNEELNVKVGYTAKEGGFKDIQKNLMIFCELYDIDYNAIDVRTPEETDVSGGNDSSQGEMSEVTRTYIDMVKDMLLLNNYFLDTELNRLFLNAPDEVWGKLSSLIQMYGFKDKDNEHTGYSIYMYMEGSKLGKPVPKGEKDFGGIPFKIKGENLTQFFENLPYVYA